MINLCNIQLSVLEHSGIHLGINHMGDDTHKFSGDKEHFVALSLNYICIQHKQETEMNPWTFGLSYNTQWHT